MPITLPGPELPAGPRSALIIATAAYIDKRFRVLRAPAGDAADLAGVLGHPGLGGFAVTELHDLGVHELRLAVNEFLAGRRAEEIVVVYLSCHGVLSARRRLYFAAADTDRDQLAATGLEARWLTECLDECRARRQVVILDCCFSGAFALAKGVKGPEDVGLEGQFGETEHSRGRVVLTASRATEYSFEGDALAPKDAAGSVFTAALLEGLRTGAADRDHDGFVSVSEAYAYAYARVRESGAAQTPQRWLYGGEGKEVILTRSPAGITVEPAQLDADLRAGLNSRHPQVRIGALATLAEWLTAPDPARTAAARTVMEEVAAQDVPLVASAARAYLELHPLPPARAAAPGDAHSPREVPRQSPGVRLAEAERIARTIPNAAWRVRALAHVVESLAGSDPGRARRLAAEAEDIACAIPVEAARLDALIALIKTTQGGDLKRLAIEAERIARTIPDELPRAAKLLALAEATARSDPERAERLAAEFARTDTGDESRVITLLKKFDFRGIVRAIAAGDPERAERLARLAPDKWGLDLEDVARGVAESDPDKAERIARAIPDDRKKVSALTAIAGELAGTDPGNAERLAREAARIARTLTTTGRSSAMSEVASAQARLASAVLDSDPDQAERVTRAIPDEFTRDRALHVLIPAMAVRDPQRAQRLADEAERSAHAEPGELDEAVMLAYLAQSVTGPDPRRARRLAAEAERLARGVLLTGQDAEYMPMLLAEIATAVAASDPRDAERIVGIISDEKERADALAAVALAAVGSYPEEAERIAGMIPGEGRKVKALARVAAAVAVSNPADAERIVGIISDEIERADALAAVALAAVGSYPEEAERIAGGIPDEGKKSRAMAGLVSAKLESSLT